MAQNSRHMERDKTWERLKQNAIPDVLVIGAGINGISAFRELGLAGANVVLVDAADYCSGASAALSRMVHGGLRYLENGEFRLVQESLLERNALLANAPHYVKPLPTSIPISSYFDGIIGSTLRFVGLSQAQPRRGALMIKAGLTFYDLFTRKNKVMPNHEFFGKKATKQKFPQYRPETLCSATYFDASISQPERLGFEIINQTLAENPATTALNYVRATGQGNGEITLSDELSDQQVTITPKTIINATGAWIDFTNDALGNQASDAKQRLIGGTKGSHLMIDNEELRQAVGDHMVYFENDEGRVCILFTYQGLVLVGSTDIRIENPTGMICTPEEQEYILTSLAGIFPNINIKPEQVLFTFAGVRPLPHSNSAINGQISRDHSCVDLGPVAGGTAPVRCMVGGKWTTFRAFGEQIADAVLEDLGLKRKHSTLDLRIGGGADYPHTETQKQRWLQSVMAETGVLEDRLNTLFERYGTKARDMAFACSNQQEKSLAGAESYSHAEIAYLLSSEHITGLLDLVLRRTTLAISGALQTHALNEISQIFAAERGWSEAHRQNHVLEARNYLIAYHGMKHLIETQIEVETPHVS
ncbi:glycerol-3-phosphate dehydrogenase/oxidase [Pseudovibrio sp. Tun.PSC04-5.I4]|uniref:glycerol-3-phosphate dehydrogenase/oxidase n=1 Tax=Pseudovibrio sp. Tun.PSC04-5.I4 TaxID=1798213 RepID=UPI00088B81DB|nr:glycerol-3-phosphate dehydrogenase/oxidase [Pseudovibrio sp. Tun.PSC04-5.I4]SDR25192.1 glycerol-3-phosphate dehydrogenase [Pseudovibrio sp. Tun.PSC04-5.I4]